MNFVNKVINYLWLHLWVYRMTERRQRRYVAGLSNRRIINVVFIAIDVPMWRYQYVYELMVTDPRFNVSIVLSPCIGREQTEKDMDGLRLYFSQRGISYVDWTSDSEPFDIRGKLNPDIIFYPMPYENLLTVEHDCRKFYDRLICYMSYGFNTFAGWTYDFHFCNRAWRLYYPIMEMYQEALVQASNHGRNIRVVGYSNADVYLKRSNTAATPWKQMIDGKPRKRVIWAPHHSISAPPFRSNFLWMADLMLKIAQIYSDSLQIAFKPHPSLMSQLCKKDGWGKERAERYYKQWENMANTQLEMGQYATLFMDSDAMIHDSCSFTVEYHYSQKPVLFLSKDMETVLKPLSSFGRQAYDVSYIGSCEEDIHHFIDEVVLGGNDPLLPRRQAFFNNYLLPPNGGYVAQNVVDDIVNSLNLPSQL